MEQLTRFFFEPKQILHKRYEALRALCVEKLPTKEVATRFGYSIFTVNAMKRDFAKAIKNGQTPLFFLTPLGRFGLKPQSNSVSVGRSVRPDTLKRVSVGRDFR